MSLSKLLVAKSKKISADVLFNKDWKVTFNLNYLPKHELNALIGKFSKSKGRSGEQELDSERLGEELLNTYVNGWKGVTYEWLNEHTPLDLSTIADIKAEIPFSHENLKIISENVYEFDGWLFENVKNGANFRSIKKEDEVKN